MKSNSTKLASYPYMVDRHKPQAEIIVEFSESGYRVLSDTRETGYNINGYLHCYDDLSAVEITDAVRDQIIKYYYNHPDNLPGIGATPQRQYMSGLSIEQRETIGNNGEQTFYA